MKRSLLRGLVVLSVILCLGLLVGWAHSYLGGLNIRYARTLNHRGGHDITRHNVHLSNGGIMVRSEWRWNERFVETRSMPDGWRIDRGFDARGQGYPALDSGTPFLGFAYHLNSNPGAPDLSSGGSRYRALQFIVPFWSLLVLVLVPGLASLWFLRKVFKQRRRRREGLCIGCGFDLRASPDRCPECGREAKAGIDVRKQNEALDK